jgi:hypothetical protein
LPVLVAPAAAADVTGGAGEFGWSVAAVFDVDDFAFFFFFVVVCAVVVCAPAEASNATTARTAINVLLIELLQVLGMHPL